MDWQAFALTLKLAAITTAILLCLAIPLAAWLALGRSRWRVLAEALTGLPLVLPPTVLGFYLLVLLGPLTGFGRALAKSLAAGEVVADQIEVLPSGAESDARAMNSDLDKGIEQNLDAALIQNKLHDGVKYTVKSRVVTLTGEVNSQARRRDAARVAASVPNVQQVVNELQVKKQKASSSE